jgi:hypothetical protein
MKNFFGLKELPFVLTLLLGLLGYQINQVTDSILNSPSVEYSLTEVNKLQLGDTIYKDYECLINNITIGKSFKDLTINFICPIKTSLELYDPQIIPVPPSSRSNEEPAPFDKTILVYNIKILQPGDKYELLFKSTSNFKDQNILPSIFLTSSDTVQILKASFATWVVKNYFLINLILVGSWIFLIAIYIIKLNRGRSNEKDVNP